MLGEVAFSPTNRSERRSYERLRDVLFFVALLFAVVFLAGLFFAVVLFAGAFLAAVFFVAPPDVLLPLLFRFGGGGIFAPERRASLRPMAIACFGFLTFRPLLPDSSS